MCCMRAPKALKCRILAAVEAVRRYFCILRSLSYLQLRCLSQNAAIFLDEKRIQLTMNAGTKVLEEKKEGKKTYRQWRVITL